jgi:hypothetical protein
MAKTTFGPGVIVTSKFLNGAQNIYFDGQQLDWHYPPINSGDLQRGGIQGIDNVYVTVATEQTFAGVPITGNKSFMGRVNFGDSVSSSPLAAPASYSTNAKFNQGGSTQTFTVKYANLTNADLLTKEVLTQQVANFPIIDQGTF